MQRRHSHRSQRAGGSGSSAARPSPKEASSPQPSLRESGRALRRPTSLLASESSSESAENRSSARGASTHVSQRSTALSAAALSLGLLTRAGTTARP